jgi:threonine dehydrogenase-like Zn-dependent dehydrogenase
MGAVQVVNSMEEDPVKLVELPDGLGLDVVIETAGRNAPTIGQGLNLARRGGVVAVVGEFS